jgi:hypothetical protein
MVNYTTFSFFNVDLVSWGTTKVANADMIMRITPNGSGMALLLLISVITGLVVGVFKVHDWHMKFFRRIGLTKRSSRASMWWDVFQDKHGDKEKAGAYVTVTLKNGSCITGWPENFSDEFCEGPTLFLTNASWISGNKEGELKEVPLTGGMMLCGCQIEDILFHTGEGGNDEGKKDGNIHADGDSKGRNKP